MYINIWWTAVVWKCCKFLAVCRVGMTTLLECRIDRPFPYHMSSCWVRTRPPPPVWALGRLFKPSFWRLTLSTPKCCHMDLWLAQLVLTHHHHYRLHPSLLHQHLEFKVSNSFFFIRGAFLSGRLSFALFLSSKELLFSSPYLTSIRTVPWPLVLRLLASAELQLYWTSLPAWSSREPSYMSGLYQDDPLGLLQDVPWVLSRNQ